MGNRFGNLQQWDDQANSPASPAGVQQAASGAAGDSRFSNLGAWVDDSGYAAASQSWYTGQNREGTANGWSTDYWDRMMAQNEELSKQGTLAQQFSDPSIKATGVVTWDHQTPDGEYRRFGDIYDNGKLVGNLYDQFKGNRPAADMMMADLLFDGDTKNHLFAEAELGGQGRVHNQALRDAVAEAHQKNNEQYAQFLQQTDFNEKVANRTEQFSDGATDDVLTAVAGAAGGGVIAGGAVAATGIGAIPGAIIAGGSAVVGGVAAWLNRDAIDEQAARAFEITSLSKRENGTGAAVATGIQQWSGVVGKAAISPVSNLTQGLADVQYGRTGDGRSEFYRTDSNGERVVNKAWRVADVAATVGDSLLQFASPIGVTAYTAQMGGTIAGEVGELALTGGKSFDYSRGGYDSIFTDEEGNFSLSQAAAGIGKVGIDAVQLGMARGLASKVASARAAAGVTESSTGLRGFLNRIGPKATPGTVELGGRKFVLDEAGKATSSRATLSILAPSEAIQWAGARYTALRQTAKASGALTADDIYRASMSLAMGERKIQTTVLTAMGEGYEEAVQAVLEPYSHEQSVSADEVLQSAIYGAAAGAGMGIATGIRTPSADERMFAMAQGAQAFRTGGAELTRRQWDSMTEVQKRQLVAMAGVEKAALQASYDKIIDDQGAEHTAGVVGVNRLRDAIQSQLTQVLSRATDRTDGAFVITQIEDGPKLDAEGNLLAGSVPSDAVVSSGIQLAHNLTNHLRGIAIQQQFVKDQLTRVGELLAQDPANEDALARSEALTKQVEGAELILGWGQKFFEVLDQALERLYDPAATSAEIESDAIVLNDFIRKAFNRELTDFNGHVVETEADKMALARAVSMVFARDPHDSAGSYQVLVPQVSARLTESRSDNVVEISHAVLPALRGDYDGDKVRQLAQLVLDDTEYTSARAGAHFIGAGSSVNVGAPKYEKWVLGYLAQALTGAKGEALAAEANATLVSIGSAVRRRYGATVEGPVLDEILDSFFDAARSGSGSARAKLLDGLATKAGPQITEMARGNLSNEWLWIDQLVRSELGAFQEAYAAHRPDAAPTPNTGLATPNRMGRVARERRAARAATEGQTLGLEAAGDSMFRKFQKLHYSSLTAAVLSADQEAERMSLAEMAAFYEALGQGITRSELADIRAKDEITGRVYAQLLRLSEAGAEEVSARLGYQVTASQALPIIANVRVLDLIEDENGNLRAGGEISLAQLLLKRSVAKDRRDKAAILEISPELQAKHARLESLTRPGQQGKTGRSVNAQAAFVEVVGAQQLYTLLGEDAGIFGPHLTVEQFVRGYVSLSELDRREEDRKLRSEAAYLGRQGKHDMPFDLNEVAGGGITAYRAVVDAILATGHHRITIDERGDLHGEVAERSARVSADFRDFHAKARTALQTFLGLSPKADGELDRETVARLLEQHPDFAASVMELIPTAAAPAALTTDGRIANWVFDLFTIRDAKHAEMHYWRNVLLAETRAANIDALAREEGEEGERGRQRDKLPRRMHRVLFDLALDAHQHGGLLLSKFIEQLETATDLDEFMRWVNTFPGLRGNQAPLTAWVDDVAEFDKDKAGGGWTTALQGAELREAIGNLRRSAQNLVSDLAEERAAAAADVTVLQAVRRHLAGTGTAEDKDLHDRFAKALSEAGERAVGLGPQAMLHQIVGAVRGFYAQAHTKGKNPPNVEPAGSFDAGRDAFDYVTNYERVMAALTATNLDALGGNLGELAKDGVRSMDDFGRVVEWEQPTVEQMLDLLENADTRPLARSILFPKVMERTVDGRLSPQLLVGKDLKSLLMGTSHNDLFPRADGTLSRDAALRYLSAVEATARRHGGHFSVQRLANDLAIARTSAADHVLTTAEIETMALDALTDIAAVLQKAGAVAASHTQPGVDPLADVLDQVRRAQRRVQTAARLGLEGEAADVTDAALDQLVSERKQEMFAEINGLLDAINSTSDPVEQARLQEQVELATAAQEQFTKHVDLLRTDDLAAAVVDMFSLPPDPTEAAVKKEAIVEYVASHLSLLERSSASMLTLSKLTEQLLDSGRAGQPELSDAEWHELSRAVIAAYLDDAVSLTAANVSVPPFPDLSTEMGQAQARYYDTSFSYLVEPLLDSKSPLVQAAREVHLLAGRLGEEVTDDELRFEIDRSIFKQWSLGQWTSDIPRASIEANQRLDSAAAAPAIAMAGNSPKRQAVISAATRRTFEVPGDELLSTTALTWIDLNKPEFEDVEVILPGGVSVQRPLAQISNRFAKTVMLTYVDAEGNLVQEDLLATDRSLGAPFMGDERAAGSGLQEIHVDRIRAAVERAAQRLGISEAAATVNVEFFHPDSQPAGPEWFNNLYFEGTSFKLDADRHESLNATLWFANGSINPAAQAAALDASKLGQPALKVIPAPSAMTRLELEAEWDTDLAAVLRRKTQAVLETDMGFGKLDPEFYNAVYKNLKLRHFVRSEGRLLPAEQVIAMQQAGEPLAPDATLWIPTDDVLRSMLGEQGTQGVARLFDDQLDIDLSMVPTYRGVDSRMQNVVFAGISGETTALPETRLRNRARQQQLVVRAQLDERTKATYDAKMRFFAELKQEVYNDRATLPVSSGQQFSTSQNMARALQAADGMLRAENVAFDWSAAGIPFIGPRMASDTAVSELLLHELAAALKSDGFRTGWVYREGSDAKPPVGELNEVSLGGGKTPGAFRVAPGDLVVVELDSFKDDLKLAMKRIDYFVDRGATVVLGQTDGRGDMRADLAAHLEANNYERVAGSKHVYVPNLTTPRYQNQRARVSTLVETRGISRRSKLAILNVLDKQVEENAAWVGDPGRRLASIAVTVNLVPVDFLAGFNVPATTRQVEKVRAHLRGLDTEAGRRLLLEHAGDAEDASELLAAYDRMLARFDDHPGVVLPQPGDDFGTGDLIPLVDNHGRVLLYRHGFKAPTRAEVERQAAVALPDGRDAANVAVFSAKTEPLSTTHRGTVVRMGPRAQHGLEVELDVPLQQFGDKKVLEWNGMKYLLTPRPDSIALPDHGFFANGWGVDLIASAHDMASKESFDGLVNNHRNAFAYFGIDFLPDVAKFFGTDQRSAYELLSAIARTAPRISVAAADELLNAPRLAQSFRELLPATAQAQANLAAPGWVDRLAELDSVEAKIAGAMIVYLMTPGARVDDVLRSGGFNDDAATPDAQSRLMPRLFTQVFDNAQLGSDLRTEMNRRFNAQLFNPVADGSGYSLAQDWTFEVRHGDRRKNLRGFLQFAEAHSAGDNPVKNGMAFDDTERGAVSQHSADVAYQAIGADTAYKYDLSRARAFAEGRGLEDLADGGVWRMLTKIDPKAIEAGQSWRRDTPAEAQYRADAREAVATYRQALVTDDKNLWTVEQQNDYAELAKEIVRKRGLLDAQSEIVDYWVRQMLGRPAGVDDAGERLDKISGRAAIEAANDILLNVEQGYLPTLGAMVPGLHVHDLQLLYRANAGRTNGWAPRDKFTPDAQRVSTWNDWVNVALGSVVLSDELFDPIYLTAADGFLHTYQAATRSLLDLPVSLDQLEAVRLLLPETNAMQLSMNPDVNLLSQEVVITDLGRASTDQLLGKSSRIPGRFSATAAPASEVAQRREALRKWRKENDVPIPVDITLKDLRRNGAQFIDRGTSANALSRMLINLRVGTATINPALYVSMGPEQWYRGTLDRAANILTGQATTGATANLMASAGLNRFSPEQLGKLGRLYDTLGQRKDFQAMVYRDLMFLRPHMAGISKVEKWLEGYAKFGSRMQDPTWGMRAKTLARRYVEAAMQHILADPLGSNLTVDTLIAELNRDPQFLQKNYPDAHIAAANAVAQIRSLKQTVASKMVRGLVEPMSESSHGGINMFGNVVLRMPLLFAGYATNVLTTLTGMQGVDQFVAMVAHGRGKGLVGKMQARLRGDEFDPATNVFDATDIVEGIDLSRAFIRGGLTHAGLFMFGMLAGSLGLSGEDDETKKRRRLAELQGVPFVYDRRRLENDFRNQDAIFLDNIPFLGTYFKVTPGEDGQSMAQLHWTLKQFVSPIMGMEKFFETGDFNHVTWGFQDALGSMPLINTLMWDDAVSTAHEMAEMAADEQAVGGPHNMVRSAGLLANAVGTYERMLFENSFVNMIYTGMDRYDRNPYALPLRDSDGTLQRDIEGNVRPNDMAMESYIDPETGMVQQGYLARSDTSGMLHALTENRASLAAFMWLLPGVENDYFRSQMAPKTREIEKPGVTQKVAEATVRSALNGLALQGDGMPRLTQEEITYALKGQAMSTGNWDLWNNVDKIAAKAAKDEPFEALSVLDEKGVETLTEAGSWGVLRGLAKGSVQLGDESLVGIHIPFEMRQAIQEKWMKELVQEGVNLGLDQTKAHSRMKRLWYGPSEDPTVQGIGDILWSKDISYSPTVTYNQLNTTYVMGPDGRPWATGFTRDGVLGALGLKPLKRAYLSEQSATGNDGRLNTTDLVNNMNTGLRGLELVDDTRYVPTDVEIGKAIEDAIAKAGQDTYTPYANNGSDSGSGGGWVNYGGYGGGYRRGGYGGYGGGGGGYYNKMYALPHGMTPYGNSIPFINTSNPIIRRADVRRERIWSERGRLKQWQ